jgi:hypothetical protein
MSQHATAITREEQSLLLMISFKILMAKLIH